MDQSVKLEQAKAIASLLPALMNELFTLDNNPVADLPLAQLRVCAILYDGPRPMSALSKKLGVSLSAMTQIADRLERAKLVSRVARGNDRRVRCLQLTPQGEEIMHRHRECKVQRVLAAMNHLSPKARKRIVDYLKLLMHASVVSKTDTTSDGKPAIGAQRRRQELLVTKAMS